MYYILHKRLNFNNFCTFLYPKCILFQKIHFFSKKSVYYICQATALFQYTVFIFPQRRFYFETHQTIFNHFNDCFRRGNFEHSSSPSDSGKYLWYCNFISLSGISYNSPACNQRNQYFFGGNHATSIYSCCCWRVR